MVGTGHVGSHASRIAAALAMTEMYKILGKSRST